MPNYAGLADFLGPLHESMKAYNQGQKDRAKELLEQVNSLMDAYETQQRASYQSAQAYRTQQLAQNESAMAPLKRESERQLGYQRGEAGKLSESRATTETEVRPYKVETEKLRPDLITAQTDLAKSKVVSPADMRNLVVNTPELLNILGDKETYSKAEVDAGLKILRDQALNAKDAKQLEYIDARIGYTDKLGDVADARIADIKAGGTGGVGRSSSSELNRQRKLRNDAIESLMNEGYDYPSAANKVDSRMNARDLNSFISSLDEEIYNAKFNELSQEEIDALLAEKKYYEELRRNMVKRTFEKTPPSSAGKPPQYNFDDWRSLTPADRQKIQDEAKNNGVTRIDIYDDNRLVMQYRLLSNGRWGTTTMPQATQQPTTPKKETQKPVQKTQKAISNTGLTPEQNKLLDKFAE